MVITRLGKLEVNKWQRTANENAAGIRRIRYSLILQLVALIGKSFTCFVMFLFSFRNKKRNSLSNVVSFCFLMQLYEIAKKRVTGVKGNTKIILSVVVSSVQR